MMKTLTTLLCAALLGMAACGGHDAERAASPTEAEPPAPAEAPAPDQPPAGEETPPATPPEGAAITQDDCLAAGGSFVPSIGSEPSCPEGKKLIAPVRFGIEGGLCCEQ